MPSAIVEITEPQATDNCGSVVISGVRSDGLGLSQPYPIGLTTIFWAATDVCGNPASCTQTIQVLSIDQAFITISNTSITEGSDMVFTVTLSGNAPGGFTLSYSTANHTAIAPGDYTPSTGILQFTGTNGETKTISVSTIDDALVEPTETFYANLSNLIYAGVNLTFANTQGIGTIVDNDAATLTINNISVAESEGQAIFTIALSNAVQNDFSLGYLTANGTAIAPDDYSTTNATLIFGGIHPLSRNISIAILDDQLVEPTENFFVNLINLQHNNQTITIAAGQGTGTIIDNDVATVSINYAQVTEGQIAVFTVSLTGKVQGGFRVNYTTQNNTAISPGDYTQTTGLLTFAGTEGETATISVSTVDDNLVEPIEDFYVMLSNLQWGGGNLTFTFMGGLGVITDNDVATVAINDVTVVEGIAAVFNVTLTGSVQGGFTVNFATANNTAVAPGDYLPVTGTLSFTG
ncbi:MAG: Calx-beta domain-containing protein, partial [Actinomycetota bacterium]|nr:Calx-beta domain-containing protein [Actinomycetota bacterium]